MTSDAHTIHEQMRKMAPSLTTGPVEQCYHDQARALGSDLMPNVLKLLHDLDRQNFDLRQKLGSVKLALEGLNL